MQSSATDHIEHYIIQLINRDSFKSTRSIEQKQQLNQ